MHCHILTPLLLSAIALALPQTDGAAALAGLPACAQDSANAALGASGCALNDKNCICSSQPFIQAITTAVTQTCTAQDAQAALIFGQSYCGAALQGGGSSSSSAPAAAGDTATSSAPASSPTATDDAYNGVSTTTIPGTVTATTSIPGAMPSGAMSNSTMSDSSAMQSGVMMTTTQCTTTTTMVTSAAKTSSYGSTFTGAAVKNVGQGMMAAVVGVAGAIALL
ncbi:hypothetical protein H2200_005287 [Cladophialophora chaetospira]|uniref:CFEM domain-containing protein n=1 Tax=Cladophialophora chaetospira TaxID=386627 RepID=A0AA38XBP1_9EURO|nr:hypothetical protein H2200_005287 [Cladophialophora chaetospira]